MPVASEGIAYARKGKIQKNAYYILTQFSIYKLILKILLI